MAQDAIAVLGKQHGLSKNAEILLPKFGLEWGDTTDNHIHSFFLAMCILGVANEDVVCHLFPFTLIGAASTWYFSLRIGSFTSWGAFQQAFLDKFGNEKTPAALVLEPSRLKMETKDKVKDFNICFNTLFNRIPANARPTQEVLTEFYITALPVPLAMWVKRSNAQTLQGAINEAVQVKNEMINIIACRHTTKEKKSSHSSKKNNGS